ncbi:hypothetical protein [Brasilonema sp. UFV-L1]|uniref:hypothetical protein n=1 Tax=Brasilonema sp. UFV-L1 TaxID=2234130 RepID=UPI00145D2C63|nr:hypothetical protein [Brasilonema sp. UFV-L1]
MQATTVGIPTINTIQHFALTNQLRKAALKGRGFKPNFSVTVGAIRSSRNLKGGMTGNG